MADQGEHYEKSWILHYILDRMVGSQQIVDIRRKIKLLTEKVMDSDYVSRYYTGSVSEGLLMEGSDADAMLIGKGVKVLCSNPDTSIPLENRDMTVVVMRKADCRPCYVTLELVQKGRTADSIAMKSLVRVQNRIFMASECFTKSCREMFSAMTRLKMETHGPAATLRNDCSNIGKDFDFAFAYRCASWPPVANEWLQRVRPHGWPEQTLINIISQSGCHVVPIGDKTSDNAYLQWRISFAIAERKLIHSLSHQQFLVYGLLKYFLKQISEMLKSIIGDTEILSSYIMKTVILFAVESTPKSLWKEENIFLCFRLCLKMLIVWVHSGYCPNFFIVSNNMFQGKLHGGNQEKILCFLMEMYYMKWRCLSVGNFRQPSIGARMQSVIEGEWKDILISPKTQEYERDMAIFIDMTVLSENHVRGLALLYNSRTEMDEFIAYLISVQSMSILGTQIFEEQDVTRGNKTKYNFLRKCKNFMTPFASVCTGPGLLMLATFYFQTGNYTKALMACGTMLSSFKLFVGGQPCISNKDKYKYQQLYCGRQYTILQKCQQAVISEVVLTTKASLFCPSQLHQGLTKCIQCLMIPPLPYAIFLSFLCYHELGDMRRRDTALVQLRAVKYNEQQGSSVYWIVNNLLGICFELVGDKRRAIREYQESLSNSKVFLQQHNPAKDKLIQLLNSQGETL